MPRLLDPDRARTLALRSAAIRRANALHRRADRLEERASRLARQAADLRDNAEREVATAPTP